jgi:hypothetical protein
MITATKRLAAMVVLLVASAALTACGGDGPCHGSECASNSMGSGNFTPGPFPHSASTLDGARCHTGGVEIGLFLSQVFTDPDPPQVVHMADPLRVYWSVCNSGLADAPAQPSAYTLTPTLVGPPPSVLPSTSFGIPALLHCTCDPESHVFQNVLTSGTYTFALAGAVTGSVNRNITP